MTITALDTEAGRRIARILIAALREAGETYRLTNAIHARSTSVLKTRTDRATEEARIEALSEALHAAEPAHFRTPFEARLMVAEIAASSTSL